MRDQNSKVVAAFGELPSFRVSSSEDSRPGGEPLSQTLPHNSCYYFGAMLEKQSAVRITRFYKDAESLCNIVGSFLGTGLDHGEPTVVIVRPDHGALIDDCLRRRGHNVDSLKRFGEYLVLDARETLDGFMIDGSPEPQTFLHNMSEVLNLAIRGRENAVVHIYGEMIDLLWHDQREGAAVRLETMWNELAETYAINAIFAYSGDFYKGPAVA